MSFINTSTSTLAQLRAFVKANNITVSGDKRRKNSYVAAIDAFLCQQAANDELLAYCDEQITAQEAVAFENALDEQIAEEPLTASEALAFEHQLLDELSHDEQLAYEVGVAEGLIEAPMSEEQVLSVIGTDVPNITMEELDESQAMLEDCLERATRKFSSFWEYIKYIVTFALNEATPVCYN